MSDNNHKKKTVKWMVIGGICGCGVFILFNIAAYAHDDSIRSISLLIGLVALLMLILSGVMYMVHYTLAWTKSSSASIEQNNEDDTLIKISQLYKEGLLTKEEFETKKKQLLGGRNE